MFLRHQSDDNVTYDYWLGLNKLAQEIGGTGAAVCIPDDEVASTPAGNGWGTWGTNPTQTIAYETDAERGKVLHIATPSTTDMAKYALGDYPADTVNSNDAPLNSGDG